MLVGERMTRPVISVRPEMPIQEALNMMKKEHVRRFPVVDARGKLVGIVAEKDLLNASPSDVTTLSVWEMTYLLSKITVDRVMTRDVISVAEDTPMEEAARIMAERKIGSLPVVRNGEMVGIITETDMFKVFFEFLGAREAGIRVEVLLTEQPGKLSELTQALFSLNANILALGTFSGETSGNRLVTFKVSGVNKEDLVAAVQPVVERIIDIRETPAS